MYTIDYINETGMFKVNFVHVTSSAVINRILIEGIKRTNYRLIVDKLLDASPHLVAHRELFARAGEHRILGVQAREDGDITFSTYLATERGIGYAQEYGETARHGGEIYSVVMRAIREIANANRLKPPTVRFPKATPVTILFGIEFSIRQGFEPAPLSRSGFILDLAKSLRIANWPDASLQQEVQFLDELPPARICWHGTFDQARINYQGVISPEAKNASREFSNNNPWIDIENNLT